MSLCERFPALTPFSLRQESLHEVCILISRLNDKSDRDNSNKKTRAYNNSSQNIRRKAKDDWF